MGNAFKKGENFKELKEKEIQLIQLNTNLTVVEIIDWHEKFLVSCDKIESTARTTKI
jgi:hypothetical protein